MRLAGREFPISLFLINVSVVTLSSEEKKLSGRLAIAVDSRCKVDKDTQDVKESGNGPSNIKRGQRSVISRLEFISPGEAELPMTVRLCKPDRAPNSSGSKEGTPGKVRDLREK